jgi:hypothetical protein
MTKMMFSQNLQPLQPLPELSVVRDTYCSQATVDKIAHYFQAQRQDLLIQVLEEERLQRIAAHYEAYGKIVNYLKNDASNEIEVPQTDLGMIDLIYELSRRIRVAYELPDIMVTGKPLAPSPDGPFPPLVDLEMDFINEKRGATQRMVDTVLNILYQRRPNLWFIAGEAARRDVGLYNRELSDLVSEIIIQEGFAPDKHNKIVQKGDLSSITSACLSEFRRRVRKMCEMPSTTYIRTEKK